MSNSGRKHYDQDTYQTPNKIDLHLHNTHSKTSGRSPIMAA